MATLIPFFQGPDEQIHYATIQYRAEPKEKTWPIEKRENANKADDIHTYRFSEELINTALITRFDAIKFESENTQQFSADDIGPGEPAIVHNQWKRYIDVYPPNASSTQSLYYTAGTLIEHWLAQESILTRLFAVRIFSVLLGVAVVWLAFLSARKIGLSRRNSLIFATLVAFQPMFGFMSSVVNIDILLILAFSLFTYAGIAMLTDSFNIKNAFLLVGSILLGLFAKGPGIALVVAAYPLIGYAVFHKLSLTPRIYLKYFATISFFLFLGGISLAPKDYFASITNFSQTSQFPSPAISLGKYLDRTITKGNFFDTARSYWGNFGWLDTPVPEYFVFVILFIEIVGFLSVFYALFSRHRPIPNHLPDKSVLLFLLSVIFTLQFAIRFYDWRVFDMTKQILIGTPGRYFLPALIAHLLIVLSGWGLIFKTRHRFRVIMKTALVLIVLLCLYSIFDIILPRYYL